MKKEILGWHILPSNKKLNFKDDRLIRDNIWYSVKGNLDLCCCGLHASKKIKDAVGNWNYNDVGHGDENGYICRVVVKDNVIYGNEKFCGRSRKVLWKIQIRELSNYYTFSRYYKIYIENNLRFTNRVIAKAKKLGLYKKYIKG